MFAKKFQLLDINDAYRHSSASHFPRLWSEHLVANTVQAKKRARQSEQRRRHNASQRSAMRTALKKAVAAVESGDAEAAALAYRNAVPILDRAVGHGIIHKNKAARHKSRLSEKIRALAQA